MTTADDVKAIRFLATEVENMEERLAVLKNRAIGVGAIVIDPTPKGSSQLNPKEQAYANYLAELDKYQRKVAEYAKKLNEVEQALETLKPLEREVVRLKYVDGMTLERIGDELGYSRANIKYHLRKALSILAS